MRVSKPPAAGSRAQQGTPETGGQVTDKQLLALYRAACGGAGRKEDPNAGDAWKRALLGYPHAEAKAALEAWWLQTAPAKGSLIDRPKGATMPTPADLRALIQASRAKAAEQTVQAIKRRQEVAEFWAWVDERVAETGETEEQILERFPSFRGTKPEAVHA